MNAASDSGDININPLPENTQALRRYTQEYEYDEIGNILKMVHQAAGGNWTRHYHYNFTLNNYLLSTSPDNNQPVSDQYTYDTHGSMLSMPHLSSMTWDFADRLQKADLGGGGMAYYVYDGGGERVRKVIERNGGMKEERLYLGAWEVFRKSINEVLDTERESLHILDDQKRVAIIDTLTVDDQNSVPSPQNQIRYQLENHLGSASLELDDLASIISYEEYHPFGTSSYRSGRNSTETSLKRYRYVGKERDHETGLYYYGARYYAAWLARFVSVDPLAEQFSHLTPFQYASNDPIGAIDIDGLESTKEQEKSNTTEKEKEQQAENKLVPEDLITANRIATEAIARFGNNTGRSPFWVDVLKELVGISTEPKRKRTEQTAEFVAEQVNNLYWSSNERRSQFIALLNQVYSEAQYLSKVNPSLYNAYNEAIQSGDIGGALGLILGRST